MNYYRDDGCKRSCQKILYQSILKIKEANIISAQFIIKKGEVRLWLKQKCSSAFASAFQES